MTETHLPHTEPVGPHGGQHDAAHPHDTADAGNHGHGGARLGHDDHGHGGGGHGGGDWHSHGLNPDADKRYRSPR